jgi:glycolate oxidase FAD binding subunit
MSSDSHATTRTFAEVLENVEQLTAREYGVDGLTPRNVVRPASIDELAEVVRGAHDDDLAMIPWGSGTQMGMGNVPSRYDVGLDLTALNEILRYDPDDMTMSVQAGCRLDDLNSMLDEHRQVLPVDAAYPERATIGGMTAVGSSGPRRLGYGPLRDLIIGMSVMSVDGVVSKAGGQVVKNVTGFDMMRLHHGALGSLGIILSVNLKVIPKPQSERTVIATYSSLVDADAAARAVAQSQLGVTALVVTNPNATLELADGEAQQWAIAARCEAPPSAVVRQAERVTEFLRDNAIEMMTEDSSERSAARWDAICKALDQHPDSTDYAFRIGRAPSRLAESGETIGNALESLENGRLALDYGSGLAYVRVPRDKTEPHAVSSLHQMLIEHSDHVTLMTGPVEYKKGIDVFGEPRAGFSMIESLKSTFDPNTQPNPGRGIGRL